MPTNNLSWTPAGGAVTSQKIKRGTSPNPTTTLTTVGPTVSTYNDSTAVAKNDYYYVVESICANGDALSNEVTICNDGDVSAPVCLGGITYDDTNSPYSGFVEDKYSGNVYGGSYSNGSGVAHHLVMHNPSIPSYPLTAATCSNYDSTNYPYGYCDGIFGAYNVNESQLPGTYSGTYFYIGLGIERSSDGGTTKEVIGEIDPSTDSVMRTVTDPTTQSNDFSTCNCSEGGAYSYINTASLTINFRPTGTDSIYYTLFPVVDANISPVRVSYSTIIGDNDYGQTCATGTKGRMRAVTGVTESGVDYDFSGVYPTNTNNGSLDIYDTGWEQTADVTGTTIAELRNKVFNASNDLYVTVDAYEAVQYGQVTRVTVTYTVGGGNPISLGVLYGPSFSGSSTNKNTQTYTISRSAGDYIRIKVLCDSTSGGGGA